METRPGNILVNSNDKRSGWAFESCRNLWMPYCQMKTARQPEHVARTEKEFIYLASPDGNERKVIDGISSWWTSCHGYSHPHIVKAIQDQAATMSHVMMGGMCHDQSTRLASRLSMLMPTKINRAFFCDSGSVAVEVALKIAVQFWKNQGDSKRNQFICFRNSYHGDTVGAMSVCDPVDSMHAHFKGYLLEQFPAAVPSNAEQLQAFEDFVRLNQSHCAGVIIEPLVQMATGMKFHQPDILAAIDAICKRYGLLMICDEIGTGFGRTGTMFAFEQAEIVPDLICIGKALTGGAIGMAVTMAADHVYEPFHSDDSNHALMHGPTFMGNPLACAAANASLDLFEKEPRLKEALALERRFNDFASEVSGLPSVKDARVRGALIAIQGHHAFDKNAVMQSFLESDIWLRSLGDVIYLAPALNISKDSIDKVLAAIERYFQVL